jgi:multidrug efflux pump subunit AcrB
VKYECRGIISTVPDHVIVRVVLVIVFGYVSLTFLSVELKPETEQPVLVVSTKFSGSALRST